MPKIPLRLLETSACHLCEQALTIITQCLAEDIELQLIDIAEHPEWQSKYAIRIPVLYHPTTQTDLGWPFDQADVNAFIETLRHD